MIIATSYTYLQTRSPGASDLAVDHCVLAETKRRDKSDFVESSCNNSAAAATGGRERRTGVNPAHDGATEGCAVHVRVRR
jgi:hypothetical protein